MKLTRRLAALAFSLLACNAQDQPQNKPRKLVSVQMSAPPSVHPDSGEYVNVSTTASLGPMGYLQMPSGLTHVEGAAADLAAVNGQYKFPSIYLYISASPLLLPQLADGADPESIEGVKDADRDITWMDATFHLTTTNEKGDAVDCPGNVQIIGMLPGATLSTSKTPVLNTAASATNQLITALAPFFPSVKAVAEASSSALQVLFTDLFPPKAVAYQYSFMDGPCTFGWYYKANAAATPPVSILGIQTGLILLRTTKDVARIGIEGRVLSSWNKPPTKSSKQFSYVTTHAALDIPTVKSTIDFGSLQDLSLFPILISAEDARKILHIAKDADWQSLITSKDGTKATLQTTPMEAM